MNRPNNGAPWGNVELETLERMWERQAPLEEICLSLGRSASAIASRLVTLGKIYYRAADETYYPTQPWMSMKEVRRVESDWEESENKTVQNNPID